MDSHTPPRRSAWWRRAGALGLGALIVTLAAGCSESAQRGFLPGYSDGPVTDTTDRITHLWVGSWIAALAVGVLTWGLMIWCIIVYRKRKNDNQLPVQTRYHMPLEIMYTAVPLIMVGVMYAFTARDMAVIRDTSAEPDVTVQVIGKQWSWDFNYVDDDVWDAGVQVNDVGALDQPLGEPGTDATLPTLYLPVDATVRIEVEARDVIHSFWVPAFLDKMDAIPGQHNVMQIKALREGVYAGKCAELCGERHSGMLFQVKVVPQSEYDAHMADLAARGQTGQLGLDLNREQSVTVASASEGEN